MNVYTERDYKILLCVLDKNDKTKGLIKGNGSTISDIYVRLKHSNQKTCDKKIRQAIKKCIEDGFVQKSLKKGNADTFILTQLGMQELRDLKQIQYY